MSAEIKEEKLVSCREERHYKVIINGKEVWVSKWQTFDDFESEGDIEIFKGKELLTEEEIDDVIYVIEKD